MTFTTSLLPVLSQLKRTIQGHQPNFIKMGRREFSIFIFFSVHIHVHVLKLCRNFEPIPIKIGFFVNIKSCSKIMAKTLYSTGSSAKFHQKWLRENSPLLLCFLMHLHVLKLCRNFELIPIKIGFFTNFKCCSNVRAKTLYYIVQGHQPNFIKNG